MTGLNAQWPHEHRYLLFAQVDSGPELLIGSAASDHVPDLLRAAADAWQLGLASGTVSSPAAAASGSPSLSSDGCAG